MNSGNSDSDFLMRANLILDAQHQIMKNLSLLFLLVCSQFLQAQEDEISSPWVLGGSFSFSSQNGAFPFSFLELPTGFGGIFSSSSDDIKNTTFRVSPYLGRQMNNHWMAGIDLHYQTRQYRVTDVITIPQQSTVDYKRNSKQYAIGLLARYSFIPDGRFDFFLQPYGQLSVARVENFVDEILDDEQKANYINLGSDIGLSYNISDRWRAILRMGGLRYITGQGENANTGEEQDFSTFGLNMSLESVGIGAELRL